MHFTPLKFINRHKDVAVFKKSGTDCHENRFISDVV